MVIDNTLFLIILAAVTLAIIVLLIVVGKPLIESMKKKKESPEQPTGTSYKCAHFFGHLSKRPRGRKIPNECYGCALVIDCIKATPQTVKANATSTAGGEKSSSNEESGEPLMEEPVH